MQFIGTCRHNVTASKVVFKRELTDRRLGSVRPRSGPRRSQEDDAIGREEVDATLQELAEQERLAKEKRLRNNKKAAERRKAKKQQEEDLRSAAQDVLGLSAKEFRQKIKEFMVLLPGVKEPKLLSSLDPESLTELLSDPRAAAAKLIQLSMDHRGVDIPYVVTTWPLILTTRHRASFLLGHTAEVNSIALGPDADTAVSAGSDNLLRVWDLRTGACTASLPGHTDRVLGLALSSDGRRAVSASADNSLRLWDLTTLTCIGEMSGESRTMLSVALTPDGSQALSGSAYGDTLALWDLASCSQLATLLSDGPPPASAAPRPSSVQGIRFAFPSAVYGLAISADGRRAVTAGTHVILWDLPTCSIASILQGPSSLMIWCLAMTSDGRLAVVGCNDAAVRVWDLEQYECTAELEGHSGQVRCVAITPDDLFAVSGSNDGTLRVWELATGSCRAVLQGHVSAVLAVAVSPDGRRMVSGGHDQVMKVWDLQEVLGQKPGGSAATAA